MERKHAAAIFLVTVVVVGVAALSIYRMISAPTVSTDEFKTIDDQLDDLTEFLDYENQLFGHDLGEISGDWG